MNANPKSTKEDTPAGKAEAPEVIMSNFAAMYHRGVERYADLHKTTLDSLHQHMLDMSQTWRSTFRNMPLWPGSIWVDMAEETMGRLVEAEKNIVDLMVKQSAQVVDLTKERTDSMSKVADVTRDLLKQTAERGIAVQRIVLDLAAEQNKAVTQVVRKQAGPGTPVANAAETIEKNVGAAIDTQKEILEAAGKPLKTSAKA